MDFRRQNMMSGKRVLSLILLFIGLAAYGQEGYVVSAHCEKPMGKTAVLTVYDGDSTYRTFRQKAADGTFSFSGTVKGATLASLQFAKGEMYFYLENAEITIQVNADEVGRSPINGSRSNGQYRYLLESLGDGAGAAKWVRENHGSLFASWLLYSKVGMGDMALAEELYGLLDGEAAKGYFYWLMGKRLAQMRRVADGCRMMDFVFTNDQGKRTHFDSVRCDSMATAIVFGAGWCDRCKTVSAEAKQTAGMRAEVMEINIDKDKRGWNADYLNMLGVDHIPYIILLDEEGKIYARDVRVWELEKYLKAMGATPKAEKAVVRDTHEDGSPKVADSAKVEKPVVEDTTKVEKTAPKDTVKRVEKPVVKDSTKVEKTAPKDTVKKAEKPVVKDSTKVEKTAPKDTVKRAEKPVVKDSTKAEKTAPKDTVKRVEKPVVKDSTKVEKTAPKDTVKRAEKTVVKDSTKVEKTAPKDTVKRAEIPVVKDSTKVEKTAPKDTVKRAEKPVVKDSTKVEKTAPKDTVKRVEKPVVKDTTKVEKTAPKDTIKKEEKPIVKDTHEDGNQKVADSAKVEKPVVKDTLIRVERPVAKDSAKVVRPFVQDSIKNENQKDADEAKEVEKEPAERPARRGRPGKKEKDEGSDEERLKEVHLFDSRGEFL